MSKNQNEAPIRDVGVGKLPFVCLCLSARMTAGKGTQDAGGAQHGDPEYPYGCCAAQPCVTPYGCLKGRGVVNLSLSMAQFPGGQSHYVPLGRDCQGGEKLVLSCFQISGGNVVPGML